MNKQMNAVTGNVRRLRNDDVALDELSLRGAVLADGLMLTQQERDLTLHTIERGRARLLGAFASAAEAWQALDELDVPKAELEQAA